MTLVGRSARTRDQRRQRVLLVSPDRIAPEMAGAGIRYVELSRVLASHFEVRLGAPGSSVAAANVPTMMTYDPGGVGALRKPVLWADVVISPPLAPRLLAGARPRRWIVDLYNPEPFEGLELHSRRRPLERKALDVLRIDRIAYAIRRGSAFVCASERQRDMWFGFLAASRRLASDVYDHDPELRSLIAVVPSGLPAEEPQFGDASFRGRVFPEDARILVWHGGMWDWLDPPTALRGLALLRKRDARWRLVFTGASRPSHRPAMSMSERAVELARDLGLEQAGAVHFATWTPYEERAQPLLEADVGVSLHLPTLESRFAFRTRMLDYVWTRLPIVASAGDEWADRIERHGLGEVVAPGDPAAFAAAVEAVAGKGREAYDEAFRGVARALTWAEVARPLIALVASAPAAPRSVIAPTLALRHSAAALLDDLRGSLRRS